MCDIRLAKAGIKDAGLVHRLQREAFMPLYERYHDDETSPALETVGCVAEKIACSDFYIIFCDEEPVGGVRVRCYEENDGAVCNISPLFIIPSYWDKGIGSAAVGKLFSEYSDACRWTLATIGQDERNCHFYEKLGFVRTGTSTVINEHMTIIGYMKEQRYGIHQG